MDKIRAILFDLDDTLYLQADWLAGAWDAVANAATTSEVERQLLRRQLGRIAEEGSGGGQIIDRALAAAGLEGVEVAPLVDVFLRHEPRHLELLPGVEGMFQDLCREGVRTAIVTDGDVRTQRSKINALGLDDAVDVIVMSDVMGREFRKPDPRSLLVAMDRVGAEPRSTIMIGDRPEKDVAAADAAGIRSVRVRTGEYAKSADDPAAWRSALTVADAVRAIRDDGLLRAGVPAS